MTVSILLADDHPLVRTGLRSILEIEPDFKVMGEAADGLEAKTLVERLKPDVLILDVMMPRLNGLEAVRQIRQLFPTMKIILLSMHANESYVLEALRNGANGYVLKQSDVTEMTQAVRSVLSGQTYLSPPLSERAIEAYRAKAEATLLDAYETLTTREREVLQLAAEGRTAAEIAQALSISRRTAEVYRGSLMRKLGLRTQTDLVRYAIRRGILSAGQ